MFPIRGQTVLVRAPWVKFGRTISSKDGLWTYIIPRKGGTVRISSLLRPVSQGVLQVILGGTKAPGDWHAAPRPETTADILRRCLALAPELVPPEKRAKDAEPTVDALFPFVIEEGCGLRPARKGGIRLEVEWVERGVGRDTVLEKQVEAEAVPIVFNYGRVSCSSSLHDFDLLMVVDVQTRRIRLPVVLGQCFHGARVAGGCVAEPARERRRGHRGRPQC